MPLRRTSSSYPTPIDTMSDTTDTPKKQGQRRRRRRGGRNRNNNQNSNSNNQSNRSQGSKGSGGQQGNSNKGGGNNSGGNSSGRRRSRSRNRGPRKPIKLSWWEKLLVAVGFKEDPNKRQGKGKPQAKKDGKPAPKSNTRNARSKQESGGQKTDSTRKRNDRGGRDKRRRNRDTSSVESGRVYVGNLSYDVTEEDLKELFKGIGTVRRVEIVYNRNTHRSKGYGFVEMMNKDDAIRSVEVLDDQPFMGRNMNVSGAKNKSESTDPDELEPEMVVNASEIELAPLPEKVEEEAPSEAPAEAASTEAPAEAAPNEAPTEAAHAEAAPAETAPAEPVAEAPAEAPAETVEPTIEAPAEPVAKAPAEVSAEGEEEEPKQA